MTRPLAEVAEFVLRQVNEDERVATLAKVRPILAPSSNWGGALRFRERIDAISVVWSRHDNGWNGSDHGSFPDGQKHFETFDPDRMLAECQAKRAIVERYMQAIEDAKARRGSYLVREALGETVLALARIYSAREGFRKVWAA